MAPNGVSSRSVWREGTPTRYLEPKTRLRTNSTAPFGTS